MNSSSRSYRSPKFHLVLSACLSGWLGGCATPAQRATTSTSTSVLAAFESDIHFTGGCRLNPAICRDFWNRSDSDLEALEHDQCELVGGRWNEVPCTTSGRYGGCKSKIDENGAFMIQWYYAGSVARDARELCEHDGPSVWLE